MGKHRASEVGGDNDGTALPGVVSGMRGLIGNTPLIRLDRLFQGSPAQVLVKWERMNPAGSAKDRVADAMMTAAMAHSGLRTGGHVIESTSGNLGVALAQQCCLRGVTFHAVVDPRTNPRQVDLMRAYGADVMRVTEPDPVSGEWLPARIAAVSAALAAHPGWHWPNQYANPVNPAAHCAGTAAELWAQAGSPPDVVVVAASSCGTLSGLRDYIDSRQVPTRLVAVDTRGSIIFGASSGPRRFPGIGAGVIPTLAGRARPDDVVMVSDEDCVAGAQLMLRREALLCGASGGAVVAAAARIAAGLAADQTVAMLAHDGGEAYLDTLYNPDWLERELGLSPAGVDEIVGALARRAEPAAAGALAQPA
ncbi:pyridoxal-phosphate dependent enzyme [Tomitella biformata]|uniref:pyridoxal-phosphate dependent enzyme n=1 Tax=Tomitella biformata TaxID=630403 RepID=UPI000465FC13|nr:pyridoxal-phosphate dependent enzyme [Tomitella biformata]